MRVRRWSAAFIALVCVAGASKVASAATCIPIASVASAKFDCEVTQSGVVAGGDKTLTYQVQEYRYEGTIMAGAVAILGEARRLVVSASAGDAGFDAPTQFTNQFGTFLDLGAQTHGTGQFPLGSLFRRDRAAWTKIDVESWQNDLGKRLPKGFSVWRGPYPDYPHLAASAVVRQEPPATGADPDVDYEGYAAVLLTVKGNRLAVTRAVWKLGSDGPCAVMSDYPGCPISHP